MCVVLSQKGKAQLKALNNQLILKNAAYEWLSNSGTRAHSHKILDNKNELLYKSKQT